MAKKSSPFSPSNLILSMLPGIPLGYFLALVVKGNQRRHHYKVAHPEITTPEALVTDWYREEAG